MTPSPEAGSPPEPGKQADPELDELERQAARVQARQKLLEARLGLLAPLSAGVADGPSNTVEFASKAGSLAPWLAHTVIADVAASMAEAVWGVFHPKSSSELPLPAKTAQHVVFVTDDAELLASDVVSRQVQAALAGREGEARAGLASVDSAMTALEQEIARYEEEQARRHQQRMPPRELLQSVLSQADEAAVLAKEVATPQEPAPPEDDSSKEPEPESTVSGGASPLSAAVDLIKLLAVDYTVAPADVTPSSALLARLTAGQLAGTGNTGDLVLLDGFALANDTQTFRSYAAVVRTLTRLANAVQALGARTAPVLAEANEYRSRVARIEKAWTEAVADKDAAQGAAEDLEEALEELRTRLAERLAAATPAKKTIEFGTELIASLREELMTLAIPDAAGISPLQRASSRDRLHDNTANDSRPVTHVLLVEATHAGADIVTRRSILGASGRVGYLGGANGAWVMIDTAGTVVGGGAVRRARTMTHDIASGESRANVIEATSGKWVSKDPLEKNEKWIRAGVLVLSLALALISVAAILAVFL